MIDGTADILAAAEALGNGPAAIAAVLFATTFLLEDAAALAAAFLIAEGVLSAPVGYLAVAVGIYAGDLWLYSMGYGARRWRWLRGRIGEERLETARQHLDRRLLPAVLIARALPTVRLPTYLGLGYTGVSFRRFALIAAPAVFVWTFVLFGAAEIIDRITSTLPQAWRWTIFAGVITAVAVLPFALRRRNRPQGVASRGQPISLLGPVRVILSTLLPWMQGQSGRPGPGRRVRQAARALPRHSVEAPGHRLSVLRAGDPGGVPVLLVHGTPGSAEGWANWLIEPPPGFHLIAVDRPGFGQSSPPAPLPTLEDQAAALLPLLRRLGRDGWGQGAPILLGHSLGGPLAALLALEHTGPLAGLVIAGGALDPALEQLHWLQRPAARPPLSWLLPRALDSANRELIALEAGLRRLAPRLGEIAAPVVIVHGDADDLVPFENVDFMRRALTGAARVDVHALPGRDHFLPWGEKAALIDALRVLASSHQPHAAPVETL
jgi:pimeloyl-ACP methyl ester carboxylesterase/membrane protein DedA with SNARE-associated domain